MVSIGSYPKMTVFQVGNDYYLDGLSLCLTCTVYLHRVAFVVVLPFFITNQTRSINELILSPLVNSKSNHDKLFYVSSTKRPSTYFFPSLGGQHVNLDHCHLRVPWDLSKITTACARCSAVGGGLTTTAAAWTPGVNGKWTCLVQWGGLRLEGPGWRTHPKARLVTVSSPEWSGWSL